MNRNKLRARSPRILWPPPPKCIAAIASDKQGLPAHRRRRLSESPAALPPFPLPAPHRSPPAPPAALPTPGDSVPAGLLGYSAPHSSVPPLQTPPPLPPDSSAPALRTTPAHTGRWETRLWSRSTRTEPVPAPS